MAIQMLPLRLLLICFNSKGHVSGVKSATLRLMILANISFPRNHLIREFKHALFNSYQIIIVMIIITFVDCSFCVKHNCEPLQCAK